MKMINSNRSVWRCQPTRQRNASVGFRREIGLHPMQRLHNNAAAVSYRLWGGSMKAIAIAIVTALSCMLEVFAPVDSLAQERVRIGVPLFPTVSFPVLI